MSIQKLVDQRVTLIENARAYLGECEAERGALSADESARFDAMHDEADAIKAKIDELESHEEAAAARTDRQEAAESALLEVRNTDAFAKARHDHERKVASGAPSYTREEAQNEVLNTWGLNGRQSEAVSTKEFANAFSQSGCSWDNQGGGLFIPFTSSAPRLNDLVNAQSTSSTAGGHTTKPEFMQELERALLLFGGVRRVARIIRTATGSAMDFPTVNDTSNSGVLLSENVAMAEQDVSFGNLTLDAYKYSSRVCRVSTELMQDSQFNMAAEVGSILGERLARIQNTHATTGTGSSQPNGCVVASSLGKTSSGASAITMDELLDLRDSVDANYRGSASWMFADSTLTYLRKLKSTDNHYHWFPSMDRGEPDMLFGAPVIINDDMAAIATAVKTALYGDFNKYLIREVAGITIVRLDERYADFAQTGFLGLMRFDSDLLDAGTNPLKHLLQA